MIRRSAFVMGAAVMLALTACSGPGSTTTGATSESGLPDSCSSDKPVLGVSLPNTVNPYYVAMRESFMENGAAAGFDVKVAIANDSDSTQLAQVQSFIEQKVCIVALNPVSSGPGAADVNALTAAGIPVITVNIDADREQVKAGGGSIVQYVGADQEDGGRVMADAALEDLGDTIPIVGIAGEPDQNVTVARVEAFTDRLTSESADAEVVASVDTNVDPQVALKVVTEMLQGNPTINLIFADTGPAAVGAIQAIKQLGLANTVSLYGFCAANEPLDVVVYRGCSAQLPSEYAKIVSENAAKYIAGETLEPQVNVPVKVISEGETPAPNELG